MGGRSAHRRHSAGTGAEERRSQVADRPDFNRLPSLSASRPPRHIGRRNPLAIHRRCGEAAYRSLTLMDGQPRTPEELTRLVDGEIAPEFRDRLRLEIRRHAVKQALVKLEEGRAPGPTDDTRVRAERNAIS